MDTLDQIKATLSNGFADLNNDQWRELFRTLNLQVFTPSKNNLPLLFQGEEG